MYPRTFCFRSWVFSVGTKARDSVKRVPFSSSPSLSKLQITTDDLEPQLFSHLRHLQELDLSDNLLERLPENLSLPNLRVLNCNNNNLEDVIALQQFPQLEELQYLNNGYLTVSRSRSGGGRRNRPPPTGGVFPGFRQGKPFIPAVSPLF